MSDAPVSVNLVGHRDVINAFRDLKEYLPKNALRTSVRKAAEFLSQLVSLVAPKLTGNLARNIVVKTRATERTIRARVVINTAGKEGSGKNAFYWRFLEEGFHTRRGDFRKFPFIAGVFDAKHVQAAQLVIDSCEQAIERAERKAKKAGA